MGEGAGVGAEGSGREAAETTAGTVFARRAMRARIPPVGVAELKCIRPRACAGLRARVFLAVPWASPPSSLPLTFVARVFRNG